LEALLDAGLQESLLAQTEVYITLILHTTDADWTDADIQSLLEREDPSSSDTDPLPSISPYQILSVLRVPYHRAPKGYYELEDRARKLGDNSFITAVINFRWFIPPDVLGLTAEEVQLKAAKYVPSLGDEGKVYTPFFNGERPSRPWSVWNPLGGLKYCINAYLLKEEAYGLQLCNGCL